MFDFNILITNKIFISCFLILAISQTIKTFVKFFQLKKFDFKIFFETGGMPSSHSAIAFGLFFSLFLYEGITTITIIVFFLALLIIRDSFGLRREVGMHAKILNKLKNKNKIKTDLKFNEFTGHSLIQVISGIVLAFIICLIVYFI
ncbi:MAG: divergent PAP2 family protein [Nanoarchaeota archaeon]